MTIIEKNGFNIPDHLTPVFFSKTLEVGLRLSYVEIEKIAFTMGCSGGDNYTSFIYRAKVRYTTGAAPQTVSLIVKCIPVEGDREVFKILDVYGKEVLMYTKVLPAIRRILGSQNIDAQIAPRLIYTLEEPVNTIVFQDLNEMQLILANRNHGLDETYAKLVLTKIGQFHAASMILARDQPELMYRFKRPMFDSDANQEIKDAIFRQNIADMADLVDMWPGFSDIARKLRKISECFFDRLLASVNQRESFKVLNHGDLWVNNCMFKQVNGIPEDLFLIDFQMSYYGSPALDLHYFLNTSVQLNVFISKRYVLLRTYYNALRSTLEDLEYENIPSWEDLKNEVKQREFIGFWAFEAMLPLLSMDKSASKDNSIGDFNNKSVAQQKRQVMFSSERFLSTIRYALDRFDELGVLD